MGVYIKGMEMPKDGVYWCEIGVAGDIATITIHGEDRKSFHLVPVPPHGRLIDTDAVSLEGGPYEYDEWCKWALGQYQDAPTVIPSSSD